MMLPKHKERIILNNKELKRKKRNELDEQEWEQINRVLQRSWANETDITVIVFGDYQDTPLRGVVERFDFDKVMVGKRWIQFMNIVAVMVD